MDYNPSLMFDFQTFQGIAARARLNVEQEHGKPYFHNGWIYSLDDTLFVFKYYFARYEAVFHHPHPPIRMAQIERIILHMPRCDAKSPTFEVDLDPSDYPALINRHFQTRYRNCDFNINHFFSGEVRGLRYFETLY